MSEDWQDDAYQAWVNRETGSSEAASYVDAVHADPELDLTAMFLATHDLDYGTADPNQVLAAAQEADEWQANALASMADDVSQQVDRESLASSVALENTLNAFVDEHAGGDPEAATPYIDLAFKAMEDGASFDDAMKQAAESLGRWNKEVDTAKRATRYEGLGFEGGMSAAFAERRARAAADAPRPATQSDDPLTASIGRMAFAERNRQFIKSRAKDQARFGG